MNKRSINNMITLFFVIFGCALCFIPIVKIMCYIDGDSVVPDIIYAFSVLPRLDRILIRLGILFLVTAYVVFRLSHRKKAKQVKPKKEVDKL